MQVSSNVYPAMKLLWDSAKQSQQRMMDETIGLSSRKWLNEFCTVKVGTARQSGHDFAILNMAKEFEHVVVFAPSVQIVSILGKQFDRDRGPKAHFMSARCTENTHGLSDIDAIFVNCCSMISATNLEEVMECSSVFAGMQKSQGKPFGLFLVQ